jgi:hypothetical protein
MLKPAILFSILTLPLFAQEPSDAEIRKMLADRIDTAKQSVGIVVGIVSPKAAASSPMEALPRATNAR